MPYCSDIQATSQDSSVHTDLTWRHQRLCILGLYRRYRNAVLVVVVVVVECGMVTFAVVCLSVRALTFEKT